MCSLCSAQCARRICIRTITINLLYINYIIFALSLSRRCCGPAAATMMVIGQCGERQFERFSCASCRHTEWRIVFVMRFLRLGHSLPARNSLCELKYDYYYWIRILFSDRFAIELKKPSRGPPAPPPCVRRCYLRQLTYCPISTINLLNQIWLKCIACIFARGQWIVRFPQLKYEHRPRSVLPWPSIGTHHHSVL